MTEITGKRAQQEREKRLREQDAAIRSKINALSYDANQVEENFSIIETLLSENKRNKKVGFDRISIEVYKSKVLKNIAELENDMMTLATLDSSKASTISSYYEDKIKNWQERLKKLEPQIRNILLTGVDDKDALDNLSFWNRITGTIKNIEESNKGSEQSQKEFKIINRVTFSKDPDELTQTLLNFSNVINGEISAFDFIGNEHRFSEAREKFANGVLLLKSIEPTNKTIPYFEELQQKWEDKRKFHIKLRIYIVIGILALSLLFYILYELGFLEFLKE